MVGYDIERAAGRQAGRRPRLMPRGIHHLVLPVNVAHRNNLYAGQIIISVIKPMAMYNGFSTH